MKALQSLTIIALLSLVFSCDKVENPFPEDLSVSDSSITWDDSVSSAPNAGVRYVLLEEFTGHTCTNCPDAAREAERLRNKVFHEKFITISIHATETFAAPKVLAGAPAGSYQTDHRTDEGDSYELETTFGVQKGLPRGMISRTGECVVKDKWKSEADKIYLSTDPTMANVSIMNYFDDSSKYFKVVVDIEWLVDYSGGQNLQVQVVEDSVVDWQLDNGANVPDYVHRHMFRGSVNGAWGTELNASAKAGDHTIMEFTRSIEKYLGRGKTLADFKKPDFSSFQIIAFIYKRSPDFEIMQVNEAHLTPSH